MGLSLVAAALIASASPQTGQANATLFASVGPGYTISLRTSAGADVTQLAPGTYDIEIDDRSADHNFQLTGPGGVSAGTTIAFVGKRTVTVTLVDGQYAFVCDAHAYDMSGRFTVGTGTTPPPSGTTPVRLTGSVGPAATIALKKGATRVTTLKRGVYSITVDDRSSRHTFHLLGPGVDKATGVAFVGRRTWRVTLRAGTYTYRCDPHRTTMRRTFRVS